MPESLTPAELATLREHAARPSQYTAATLRADYARMLAEIDACWAELGGRDEDARDRWISEQERALKLRSMEFRDGLWEMSLEGARDMAAAYTAMAKTLLGDAPNYTETRVSFDVKIAERPDLYTLVVQRHAPGALTPHEARMRAEQERDDARAEIERLRAQLADAIARHEEQL